MMKSRFLGSQNPLTSPLAASMRGLVQFWGAETPPSSKHRGFAGEGKPRERDLRSSGQGGPEVTPAVPPRRCHPGTALPAEGEEPPVPLLRSRGCQNGRWSSPRGGRNRPRPRFPLSRPAQPGLGARSGRRVRSGSVSGWETRLESLPAPPAVPGQRLQGPLGLIPGEPGGAEHLGDGTRDPLGAPSTRRGVMEPASYPELVPQPHFGVLG